MQVRLREKICRKQVRLRKKLLFAGEKNLIAYDSLTLTENPLEFTCIEGNLNSRVQLLIILSWIAAGF